MALAGCSMYVHMGLSQRVMNVNRACAQVFRGLVHLKAVLHPFLLGDQARGSFSLDNLADRFPNYCPESQLQFVILFILALRG